MAPLELKEVTKPYKLVIGDKLLEKIHYYCEKIPDEEWSGPLFYRVEGTVAENNIVVYADDMLVMNIGNAGFTSFLESPEIIGYRVDKELMVGYYQGLIHSHNKMNTFFSGTDTNTLRSEALDHNHFVSLIVNNQKYVSAYSAGITTVMESKTVLKENYKYSTFDGEVVEGEDSIVKDNKVILWSKMAISTSKTASIYPELDERISELRKRNSVLNPNNTYGATPIVTKHYPVNGYDTTYKPPVLQQPGTKVNTLQKEVDFNQINREDNIAGYFPKKTNGEEINTLIPYGDIVFDTAKAMIIAKQLVTGAVLIPDDNKINLGSFIPSMPSMYKKRFKDIESYKFYVSGLIESLIFNAEDSKIVGFEEHELAAIVAHGVVSILGEFKSNEFLDVIIAELENYIV